MKPTESFTVSASNGPSNKKESARKLSKIASIIP
jgi:hypothetical protein